MCILGIHHRRGRLTGTSVSFEQMRTHIPVMTVDCDIGIFVNHYIDTCFYQLLPLDIVSSLPHHPLPPTPRSQVHSIFLGMFDCITSYTSTMLLLNFSVGTSSRLLLDIIHICSYSRRLKYNFITPASFRTRFFNVRFCFS